MKSYPHQLPHSINIFIIFVFYFLSMDKHIKTPAAFIEIINEYSDYLDNHTVKNVDDKKVKHHASQRDFCKYVAKTRKFYGTFAYIKNKKGRYADYKEAVEYLRCVIESHNLEIKHLGFSHLNWKNPRFDTQDDRELEYKYAKKTRKAIHNEQEKWERQKFEDIDTSLTITD